MYLFYMHVLWGTFSEPCELEASVSFLYTCWTHTKSLAQSSIHPSLHPHLEGPRAPALQRCSAGSPADVGRCARRQSELCDPTEGWRCATRPECTETGSSQTTWNWDSEGRGRTKDNKVQYLTSGRTSQEDSDYPSLSWHFTLSPWTVL